MTVSLYIPPFLAGNGNEQEGVAEVKITKAQIIVVSRITISYHKRLADRVGTFSGNPPGSVRFWRATGRRVGAFVGSRSWVISRNELDRLESLVREGA